MARVIALSSQVVRGHVGLSAIVPALQRLGHEVWAIPTILLSNHPGHGHCAGIRMEPAVQARMLDALDAHGWLAEADAVISGYLPSPEHVQFAARLVRRLRDVRAVLYLCDPVLGDDPAGLYIDQRAAEAIRSDLVTLADIVTPNAFELAWLAGQGEARSGDPEALTRAARQLGVARVIVTSAGLTAGRLANILIEPQATVLCEVERRPHVPHGTGDLLSALFLGHLLNGADGATALGLAAAGVDRALAASIGRDELALISSQEEWACPEPLPTRRP
jgi:pyridoxine kinase